MAHSTAAAPRALCPGGGAPPPTAVNRAYGGCGTMNKMM